MTPLELLYYIGYSIKKRLALKNRERLPYAVVSIGNITVGGTGKTPAAVAVAKEAQKRGFSPIILTRGYRGKAKGACIVAPKKFPLKNYFGDPHKIIFTVEDAGDEPVLMAEKLKNIPVIKSADRYEGGVFAIRSFSSHMHAPFLFILDDGFQHWRLYRDADIALIDGTNPFGNGRMLPAGPLREPLKALMNADIFVITKSRNEAAAKALKGIKPGAAVYFSEYKPLRAKDISGSEVSLKELKDRKVYAFCGIANPESFRHTVLSLSCRLPGFKGYRDHYKYAQADIRRLEEQSKASGCDFLITTEKDMVKIRELDAPGNILCLEIGFDIEPGFFDDIFRRLPDV